MATIGEKFTQLGTSIINLVGTRASRHLDNLTTAGRENIKNIAGEVASSGYHPPLLSCMWSDHLLNDMSWLRADTFSWQDGTTYSQAYNELLAEYNDSASSEETEGSITFKRTPKGYKIALSTQETTIAEKYATDGIAWYYILDTTNKKFKLPRTKFGFEGLRTSVGDDIEAGLPNITGEVGTVIVGSGKDLGNKALNIHINSTGGNNGGSYTRNLATLSLNASNSNPIYGNSETVQPPATQMYLYFYVGAFTKSAEAQTAGLKAELLNGKVDISSLVECQVVTETYTSGTSGYRIWSNGYCEQWGFSAGDEWRTITFIKTFANINYFVQLTGCTSERNGSSGLAHTHPSNKTVNSMYVSVWGGASGGIYWKVSGYLAQGEY